MSDEVNRILDDLDQSMLDNFIQYANTVAETWESFEGNEGQSSIVEQHIIEAVHEHIKAAKERWPYGENPDNYRAMISNAYSPEVMQRAFSDTIEDSYATLYDVWQESMDLQNEHESVAATIGAVQEPHSTNPPWQ